MPTSGIRIASSDNRRAAATPHPAYNYCRINELRLSRQKLARPPGLSLPVPPSLLSPAYFATDWIPAPAGASRFGSRETSSTDGGSVAFQPAPSDMIKPTLDIVWRNRISTSVIVVCEKSCRRRNHISARALDSCAGARARWPSACI